MAGPGRRVPRAGVPLVIQWLVRRGGGRKRSLVKAKVAVVLLSAVLAGCVASGQKPPAIAGLRCEYLSNPLGIDVERPRLSWLFTPDAPGRRQTAYQILVASSLAKLQTNRGDLWDSGKVTSSSSTFVPYGGGAMPSRTAAWWKVRVWDSRQSETPWSEAANWSTGILRESEWSGKFIGLPRPEGGQRWGRPCPSRGCAKP